MRVAIAHGAALEFGAVAETPKRIDTERLPMLLDDALINTDPRRLLVMQQALYQAADKLQIIVFSCQDASFEALAPARVYQLHNLRRGA